MPTESSGPGMDEAVEADLIAELALGLNLDTGDDACRDYISDIVRMVAPILEREAAAVRADERAKYDDLLMRCDSLLSLCRYREPVSEETKRDLDALLAVLRPITDGRK